MSEVVQSVRFAKTKYKTFADAQKKAKSMGFKSSGVKNNVQYANWHSFRQIQPEKFQPMSFRMKKVDSGNILFVLGKLKQKKNKK